MFSILFCCSTGGLSEDDAGRGASRDDSLGGGSGRGGLLPATGAATGSALGVRLGWVGGMGRPGGGPRGRSGRGLLGMSEWRRADRDGRGLVGFSRQGGASGRSGRSVGRSGLPVSASSRFTDMNPSFVSPADFSLSSDLCAVAAAAAVAVAAVAAVAAAAAAAAAACGVSSALSPPAWGRAGVTGETGSGTHRLSAADCGGRGAGFLLARRCARGLPPSSLQTQQTPP